VSERRRHPPARRAAGGYRGALAAALAAACLAGCGSSDPSDRDNGPVKGFGEGIVTVPQNAGKAFVFGLPIVVNTGSQPAVFERIGAENLPAGLEVMETFVVGPRRKFAQAYEFAWPSKTGAYDDREPVRGYRLPPEGDGKNKVSAQLVYVMRAQKPGNYRFDAVTIDYTVGDAEYRAVVPNGLFACILPRGVKRDVDRCPDEG
jgi:hypothetical protein